MLDTWLGEKLAGPADAASAPAIISANRNDKDHPKKAVVRALMHRGRGVIQTEGALCMPTNGAPALDMQEETSNGRWDTEEPEDEADRSCSRPARNPHQPTTSVDLPWCPRARIIGVSKCVGQSGSALLPG